ncbi:MAG: hypothetical protein LIO81_02345 [Clostridiales bacterium]|nr:hypothetical protein [Clostridiales bacterium]
MTISDKSAEALSDLVMKLCDLLGLLRVMQDAAYYSDDSSPQMVHMAKALETSADMLETYYERLSKVEFDIRNGVHNAGI